LQRYFIKLSYNGTAYNGWQIQENTSATVQQTINEALTMVLNEPVTVTGCGRTDTGVHAKMFYAHFDCSKTNLLKEQDRWVYKLNQVMPADIAIQQLLAVNENANARFDAVTRTYQYFVSKNKNPFMIDRTYCVNADFDIYKMNKAAKLLFDYTDFSAFSKSNTQTFTNNCKIYAAEWKQETDNLIFTITADRFLRNMVRAIVGTLLDIGKGKLTTDDFKKIIESKERSNAGASVPACGLYLVNVKYPENYFNEQ
jgi:tRNA pseudouridine38-40 synthase